MILELVMAVLLVMEVQSVMKLVLDMEGDIQEELVLLLQLFQSLQLVVFQVQALTLVHHQFRQEEVLED